MVQPIDLQLKGSNTQDYFAQMRQERNNNLQPNKEEQIVQEMEREIAQAIKKIDLESKPDNKPDKQKNKVGVSGLNESLNKITDMNSVIFQFEFLEDEEKRIEDRKKELILKVIDKETKKVLSQYPTEISIKVAKMLDQLIGRGQLADGTA